MLNWALRTQNQTTLYKFHGDISEVGKLVLTKESYDYYYNPSGDLVRELSKCFKQRSMLFLGCSLNTDRTMTVLEKTLEDGFVNYAIIDSDAQNIREKSRKLANKGIRAILYPKGQHGSVRMILEGLLERMNKTAFQRLTYYENQIHNKVDNRFVYTAESVGFFGREEEIKRLIEFCTADLGDHYVKWWAITGAGGSGKSRLAYEVRKELVSKNWDVIIPKQYDFNGLQKISENLNKNTLFILDYVYAYAKDIGKWFEVLYNTPSTIVKRIILIERDGTNIINSSWVNLMKDGTISSRTIDDTCYQKIFIS